MVIKASVIILLILCGLIFSGCTTKFIPVKCDIKVEKPSLPICGGLESDYEFGVCVVKKCTTLEGYVEELETALDSCKE